MEREVEHLNWPYICATNGEQPKTDVFDPEFTISSLSLNQDLVKHSDGMPIAKNYHKNRLEMKDQNMGCTWNLFHMFHFHNRHHHLKRLLGQGKSTKGDKSTKTEGNFKAAKRSGSQNSFDPSIHDTLEVPPQSKEENKESAASHRTYSGRLIQILVAEETSSECSGGSTLTNVPLPTHFGSECDKEAAETSVPDIGVDKVSSTVSINSSQDVDNFSVSLLSERCCDANSEMYTSHHQPDDLGKQLLEKHAALQKKLDEAKEAILNKNYTNVKELAKDLILNQSRDLLDVLETRNFKVETGEACSSLCAMDGSTIHDKDLKHKKTRSKLFSGLGGKLKDLYSPLEPVPSNLKRKELNAEKGSLLLTGMSNAKTPQGVFRNAEAPNHPSSSPKELRSRIESGQVVTRLREIKHRLKRVLKDNRKEYKHISMDAILHKIPYGSKSTRNEGVSALESKNRGREVGDGRILIPSNRGKEFLKSTKVSPGVSSIDMVHRSTPSNNPSNNMEPTSNLSRTDRSSPQHLSCDNVAEGNKTMANHVTEQENLEKIDSRVTDGHSEQCEKNESSLHVSDESSPQEALHENIDTETTNSGPNFILETHSGMTISHLMDESSGGMVAVQEEEGMTNALILPVSPEEIVTFCCEENNLIIQEREVEENLEDVSSSRHEIQSVQSHTFENPHFVTLQKGETTSDNADLLYVRDVLHASGLKDDDNPRQWHALDQPIDPHLFNRVECPSSSTGMTDDEDVGTNCKHQLLFDCVNEMLLQIYDRGSSKKKRCTSFSSSLVENAPSPMPKMETILDEVWAEISWHLESQSELDQSVEYLVTRDLIKKDNWMNVQVESELVASDLEAIIIDDLLDDLLCTI